MLSYLSRLGMFFGVRVCIPYLSDEQAGFRKERSTVQQILCLRLIAEKHREVNKQVYNCFVDFKKAFDLVWHDGLWAVLRLSLIHISEPTRRTPISYAVFCLKKKK